MLLFFFCSAVLSIMTALSFKMGPVFLRESKSQYTVKGNVIVDGVELFVGVQLDNAIRCHTAKKIFIQSVPLWCPTRGCSLHRLPRVQQIQQRHWLTQLFCLLACWPAGASAS